MHCAILAERLSKQFCLGSSQDSSYSTIRESLVTAAGRSWNRLRGRTNHKPSANSSPKLWALKDVSFSVEQGDVVGIIGRNGAGKSTLLKVLSRITEPTSGRAKLKGRLGSLLEVGTGFHTELTGRENIHLNGAICGMSRTEITRKFDDIVAFAEVEPFLDTPVKRYSSGMFVRLAFAVASHLEPDVLLVDEVLAVGDATFQKKCLGKLGEVSRSGRTVIFVSHNMATIVNLCSRVLLLENGRLRFDGPTEEGVRHYVQDHETADQPDVNLSLTSNRRRGCQPIMGRIRLLNDLDQPTIQFECGKPMTVELSVLPENSITEPQFAIGFEDTLGCRLFTVATYLTDAVTSEVRRSKVIRCRIGQLPLIPGRYGITLNSGPSHAAWTDVVERAVWFDVLASDYLGNGRLPRPEWGQVMVKSSWETATGSRNIQE